MDWLSAIAGFGVGALVGMTGVGGGALMTPVLVLLFGVAPVTAVGTDLWFAAITKMAGGAMHHGNGGVDWQVLRRLCLGSLPAAALTLAWLQMAGVGQIKQGFILQALGWVLILTALAMLLRGRLHAFGRTLRARTPEGFKRLQPALTVVAGAILGFLVTLTSVGAGALGTVMLLYLYPFRMTPARLVGTDIVHAIPLTMLAGAGHLAMGNVDLSLLGGLLLGSIPGVVLGATLSAKVPQGVLRGSIAAVLVVVASKLVYA
jgi:uncharacterized protein